MRKNLEIPKEKLDEIIESILPETREWFFKNHPAFAVSKDKGNKKLYGIYYVKMRHRQNHDFIEEVVAKNKVIKAAQEAKANALMASITVLDPKPEAVTTTAPIPIPEEVVYDVLPEDDDDDEFYDPAIPTRDDQFDPNQ